MKLGGAERPAVFGFGFRVLGVAFRGVEFRGLGFGLGCEDEGFMVCV